MAQFDVYKLKSGDTLVVDCQSELLGELNTRFVVPLMAREAAPAAAKRLNPVFLINSREHVMVTQFGGAVQCRELGELVASLRERSFEIIDALDVLISGV